MPDDSLSLQVEVDLLSRYLPRGGTGLTETSGKEPFIDVIDLAGRLLKTFSTYAEVALLEKDLSLFDFGSLLLQIHPHRLCLHPPLRTIKRDVTLCLHLLRRPVHSNLIGL